MTDPKPGELLEIYKLHVEMADRVSQRREGANRLYVSLLAGIVVFLGALIRFGVDDIPTDFVLCVVGAFGVLLSASWFVLIRSYRQLNTGKFLALHELEEKLTYPFYKREWDLLGEGRSIGRYWKLTVVETVLPAMFVVLFGSLIVYALVQ